MALNDNLKNKYLKADAGYFSGNVRVQGTITPTDPKDTFGILPDSFQIGGYRSVATKADLDTITEERKRLGMRVYVVETKEDYILQATADGNGVEWVLYASSNQAPTIDENKVIEIIEANKDKLKGDKGDKGDPGVAGPKGDKGDTGPAGADADVEALKQYIVEQVKEQLAAQGGGGNQGGGTTAPSIDEAKVKELIAAEIAKLQIPDDATINNLIKAVTGDITKLATTAKTSLVDAINELAAKGGTGGGTTSARAVTLDTKQSITGEKTFTTRPFIEVAVAAGKTETLKPASVINKAIMDAELLKIDSTLKEHSLQLPTPNVGDVQANQPVIPFPAGNLVFNVKMGYSGRGTNSPRITLAQLANQKVGNYGYIKFSLDPKNNINTVNIVKSQGCCVDMSGKDITKLDMNTWYEYQILEQGKIHLSKFAGATDAGATDNNVKLDTDQQITGLKEFVGKLPLAYKLNGTAKEAIDVTDDNHLTTKAYVDAKVKEVQGQGGTDKPADDVTARLDAIDTPDTSEGVVLSFEGDAYSYPSITNFRLMGADGKRLKVRSYTSISATEIKAIFTNDANFTEPDPLAVTATNYTPQANDIELHFISDSKSPGGNAYPLSAILYPEQVNYEKSYFYVNTLPYTLTIKTLRGNKELTDHFLFRNGVGAGYPTSYYAPKIVNKTTGETTTFDKANGEFKSSYNAKGAGKLYQMVSLAGNQTITGQKTFTQAVKMTAEPGDATDLVNKKYVDSVVGVTSYKNVELKFSNPAAATLQYVGCPVIGGLKAFVGSVQLGLKAVNSDQKDPYQTGYFLFTTDNPPATPAVDATINDDYKLKEGEVFLLKAKCKQIYGSSYAINLTLFKEDGNAITWMGGGNNDDLGFLQLTVLQGSADYLLFQPYDKTYNQWIPKIEIIAEGKTPLATYEYKTKADAEKATTDKACRVNLVSVKSNAGVDKEAVTEIVKEITGDLTTLSTGSKDTLVGAVNELSGILGSSATSFTFKFSNPKNVTTPYANTACVSGLMGYDTADKPMKLKSYQQEPNNTLKAGYFLFETDFAGTAAASTELVNTDFAVADNQVLVKLTASSNYSTSYTVAPNAATADLVTAYWLETGKLGEVTLDLIKKGKDASYLVLGFCENTYSQFVPKVEYYVGVVLKSSVEFATLQEAKDYYTNKTLKIDLAGGGLVADVKSIKDNGITKDTLNEAIKDAGYATEVDVNIMAANTLSNLIKAVAKNNLRVEFSTKDPTNADPSKMGITQGFVWVNTSTLPPKYFIADLNDWKEVNLTKASTPKKIVLTVSREAVATAYSACSFMHFVLIDQNFNIITATKATQNTDGLTGSGEYDIGGVKVPFSWVAKMKTYSATAYSSQIFMGFATNKPCFFSGALTASTDYDFDINFDLNLPATIMGVGFCPYANVFTRDYCPKAVIKSYTQSIDETPMFQLERKQAAANEMASKLQVMAMNITTGADISYTATDLVSMAKKA